MFIVGDLIGALAVVVYYALWIMNLLILIRVLISWVNPDPFNPIVETLRRITEPVLEPIRRLLLPMAIDISPIIAYFIIIFLQKFLVSLLYDLAARLH